MSIFVKNDNKVIFEVKVKDRYTTEEKSGKLVDFYNLEAIAVWDYIDMDGGDEQGWVSPNVIEESSRTDTISVYGWDETLKNRLIDDGYDIVEKPNNIVQRVV